MTFNLWRYILIYGIFLFLKITHRYKWQYCWHLHQFVFITVRHPMLPHAEGYQNRYQYLLYYELIQEYNYSQVHSPIVG